MHLCLCRFEVRRRERMQRERCVWYGRQSALWLAPPRLLVSRSVFYVLSSSLLTDIYPPPHSSLYPHCRHVSSSSLPAHTQAQRQWAQCVSRPRRHVVSFSLTCILLLTAGAHAGAAAMGTTRVKTATADDVLNPILAMSPQKDGAYVTRGHNGVWW